MKAYTKKWRSTSIKKNNGKSLEREKKRRGKLRERVRERRRKVKEEHLFIYRHAHVYMWNMSEYCINYVDK